MGNPFVHVELNTTDVKKSKTFYGNLFDWKLEDVPMKDFTYTMIDVGGTGAGVLKQLMPGAPSAWLADVTVEDIEEATKKARALGARVMKDVTEVTGMGWLSIIVDPTGAMPLPVPPALTSALKQTPGATARFRAFSPSQRREYSEWIVEAKTEATREKRIATAARWIAAGKTRHWKYRSAR